MLNATVLDIGLLTASFMIARAIAASIAGHLYRKRALARALPPACFALNALVTLGYVHANSVVFITALRFVQGVLNGFAWITIQIVLGASTPQSIRGTVYATYFAIGSLGAALANYIYSMLAYAPISIPLAISSVLFLSTAILSTTLSYVETPSRPKQVSGKRSRIRLSGLLISLLFFTLSIQIGTAFVSSDVVYVYVHEVYGFPKHEVGLFMMFTTLISIVLSIALSFVADRVSDRAALTTVFIIALVAMASSTMRNPIALLGAIVLLSIAGRSMVSISRRIAITYIGPEGVGYINTASNIGAMLSSIAIGALYDTLDLQEIRVGALSIVLATASMMLPLILVLSIEYVATVRALRRS